MARRRWLLLAVLLPLAACGGGGEESASTGATNANTSPAAVSTTPVPTATQGASTDPRVECRSALDLMDAYIVAKQAGRSDVADPSGARQRCLATKDVPQACVDAMTISVTIAKVSADSVDFISSYTSYGEFSTLCRLRVLRSIN